MSTNLKSWSECYLTFWWNSGSALWPRCNVTRRWRIPGWGDPWLWRWCDDEDGDGGDDKGSQAEVTTLRPWHLDFHQIWRTIPQWGVGMIGYYMTMCTKLNYVMPCKKTLPRWYQTVIIDGKLWGIPGRPWGSFWASWDGDHNLTIVGVLSTRDAGLRTHEKPHQRCIAAFHNGQCIGMAT